MMIKQKINTNINLSDYYAPFLKRIPSNNLKLEAALNRAWKNRDFEIDKYWSRATYFWAFIASTFVGYVAIITSDRKEQQLAELPFLMTCLGLIFSVAWVLANIGSKKWQENWEKHIDMLEDRVTGPIYKTVLNKGGYSVSKINLVVSLFIMVIWACLWVNNIVPWGSEFKQWRFAPLKSVFFILTLGSVVAMFLFGKTRKKGGSFSFDRREWLK
jgi:hypothetical protein